MELKIKVNIIDDDGKSVIGPGILELLEYIREEKSINKAAKRMHLSYVKALKLLNNMEEKIGKPLLSKRRGGNDRGGTELTPLGIELLVEFEKLQDKLIDYAEDEFQEFLKKVGYET